MATRRRLIPVMAALVALVCVELGSYLLIFLMGFVYPEPIRRRTSIYRDQRALMERILENTGHIELDSVLGWRYRAGFQGSQDTINQRGLRQGREYSARPIDSVTRIAAFGDSFVYGNEVANDSCWAALAEKLDPRLEILNYGVGGYGVDQAYLRFAMEGRELFPHIAVVAFTTDDLRRVVNVYRRFISTEELPLFKPRFRTTASGGLVLVPNPAPTRAAYMHFANEPSAIKTLKPLDQWYEPSTFDNPLYDYSATVRLISFAWTRFYRRVIDPQRIWKGGGFNRTSEAYKIQLELFRRFTRHADSVGVKPLILFLPDRASVERALAGEPTLYNNLVQDAARHRLPYIDGIGAFTQASSKLGVDPLFAAGGHYSGRGNGILAEWLRPLLLDLRR